MIYLNANTAKCSKITPAPFVGCHSLTTPNTRWQLRRIHVGQQESSAHEVLGLSPASLCGCHQLILAEQRSGLIEMSPRSHHMVLLCFFPFTLSLSIYWTPTVWQVVCWALYTVTKLEMATLLLLTVWCRKYLSISVIPFLLLPIHAS